MKHYVRSSPVLAEVLVSLLFLALCVSAIVGVFAGAYTVNRSAADKQDALFFARDTADRFTVCNLDSDEFLSDNGFSASNSGNYTLISGNITFVAEISSEKPLDGFTFTAYDGEDVLFSFPVVKITGEEVQAE